MEKTTRRINWNVYLAGLIITVIIFSVGVYAGIQIESGVNSELIRNIEQTKQRISSVETMLILEDSSAFCDFFKEEMVKFDQETSSLGTEIGYMEERKTVDSELKSAYMTLELRDYLLAKKINDKCGQDSSLVLYFLSSGSCKDCLQQGQELTKAREETNLRVYSFDTYINNSITRSLINSYGVEKYPTLVIEDERYEGLRNKSEIINLVSLNRDR